MKRYVKTLLETGSKKKEPAKPKDPKPKDPKAYARWLIARRAVADAEGKKRGDVGTVEK